jgi:hypothetical protein
LEPKCGCFYCRNRPETYKKGGDKGRVYDPPGASHMEIYHRLARVVNMHGHPGPPTPRKSG